MNVPNPVEFPEMTSTQINIALVADKLNEVIRYLKEHHQPTAEEMFRNGEFSMVKGYFESSNRPLNPGVTITKNGRYMRDGRFISKEEAYG
jgi:hypothetical protein